MPILETLGLQAAGAAVGKLMGIGQDARQIKQQQQLMNQQISGNKQMADYNYKKQLEMWNATNYEAQMQHLKNAGLNPGLIYGIGGGGGTTTGSAGSGVTGATATQAAGNELAMGIQSAMTAAQTELIKAQTEKTKVETAKTSGVDTTLTQAQTADLTQGIENKKAQAALTIVQTRLAELDQIYSGESLDDRLDEIKYSAKKTFRELNLLTNEEKISDATIGTKINLIKAEYVGKILQNTLLTTENTLKQAQTNKTNTESQNLLFDREKTITEIRKMGTDILNSIQQTSINAGHLSNEQFKAKIQESLMKFQTSHPNIMQVLGGGAEGLKNKIDGLPDKAIETLRQILEWNPIK